MGGHFYDTEGRTTRAKNSGYFTAPVSDTFAQLKVRRIHESMDPKNIRLREARDSDINPVTYPIIFGMDVTGSMGAVPKMLITNGLPDMISGIIQRGVKSPALLFLALGDSQYDKAPLQVGQFESGDEQMDIWLTRSYPEGGGGSNAGESYLWAWYFAANHCQTDNWDKRKEKGLLVTFGDEPCLPCITRHEMKEVMGIDSQVDLSQEDLLKAVQEKWNVFHIHFTGHRPTPPSWKKLLGQNLIEVKDHNDIPSVVATLAMENCGHCTPGQASPVEHVVETTDTVVRDDNEML